MRERDVGIELAVKLEWIDREQGRLWKERLGIQVDWWSGCLKQLWRGENGSWICLWDWMSKTMTGLRKKGLERTIETGWVNGTRLDRVKSRAESFVPWDCALSERIWKPHSVNLNSLMQSNPDVVEISINSKARGTHFFLQTYRGIIHFPVAIIKA